MISILDALATWRETLVPGLTCSHPFTRNKQTDPLPSSRLTMRSEAEFSVPCVVPLLLEERVKVEKDADLEPTVAALREMSGLVRITADARIHSHTLISELVEPDENGRWTALLRWRVVASWA